MSVVGRYRVKRCSVPGGDDYFLDEQNRDCCSGALTPYIKRGRNALRRPRSATRPASTSAVGRRRCVPRGDSLLLADQHDQSFGGRRTSPRRLTVLLDTPLNSAGNACAIENAQVKPGAMSLVESRSRHCKGHQRSLAIDLFGTCHAAVVRGSLRCAANAIVLLPLLGTQ